MRTSPPPRMSGIDSAWMSVGSLKAHEQINATISVYKVELVKSLVYRTCISNKEATHKTAHSMTLGKVTHSQPNSSTACAISGITPISEEQKYDH